jgi:tRNA(fMet)-specific endonuclease VapC
VHWDSALAKHNGTIRADMERQGKILAQLDLLNAIHALSVGAVMMTNDQAFCHVVDLFIEDWTMHPMHGE